MKRSYFKYILALLLFGSNGIVALFAEVKQGCKYGNNAQTKN